MNRLFLLFCLLGLMGLSYGQSSQTTTPTADLLDIKFRASGEALDASEKSFTVQKGARTPATLYDTTVKQYISKYSRNDADEEGDTDVFFWVDYKDDFEFKSKLQGAFTLEVYAKTTTGVLTSPVSSAQSGGFSIEQTWGGEFNQFWVGVEPDGWNYVGDRGTYNEANPQYYHMVFTCDGTTLKAYYNAEPGGTTAMTGAYREAPDADAHWIGIGGDASPYGLAQAAFDGNIGVVRMYSKALEQDEVTALYNQITSRSQMAVVDELNRLLTKFPVYINNIEDTEKKDKAIQYQQEAWQLMNTLETTETAISAFIDKVNTELDGLDAGTGATAKPVFGAISDIHVGRGGWEYKVEKAFAVLLQNNPQLDAIFITGDITDWGTQEQYDALKEFVASKVPLDEIPVYYCMGNHDWLDDWFHTFSHERFMNTLGQDINQFIDIKGYPFIMISMETRYANEAFKEKTRNFLQEKLTYAAQNYPDKPIFLFQHLPNDNTVYGSYAIGGDDAWGTNNIEDILNQYPQLIVISGHSHYPLGDERSIHQENYTSINDGSVAYSEIENGLTDGPHPYRYEEVIEGCIISIDDNEDVIVKRLDFYRNEEIGEKWVVKAPHDGSNFTYKNRTGGENPYFLDTDEITMDSNWDAYCDIVFPQAKDDDGVHHYRIEILDADKNPLPSPVYRIFSNFYLNSEMPGTLAWTVDIADLTNEENYYIQVTAIDAYGNESTPPLVSSMFTKKEFDTEAPTPNLLDVRFRDNGTANDRSEIAFPVELGYEDKTPATLYDSTIKQYVSQFDETKANDDRDTDIFYKVDYKENQEFRDKLKSAFTLEVFTKTTTTNAVNSVGAAQAGGFCIEQAAGAGPTEFWMGVESGGYGQVGNISTYNEDNQEYYHIVYTYDGSNITAYYNGRFNSTAPVATYREPSDEEAFWIGIGADASGYGLGQQAFDGNIAVVRMYDKAISKEEAYACYLQMTNRQKMTLVNDLNRIITSSLPDYTPQNDEEAQKIAELIAEGWMLMESLSTTDADIAEFKKKTAVYLGSDDTSVYSLKVNGQTWNLNDTYPVTCDNNTGELRLEIETQASASVDMGKSFTAAIEKIPTNNKIEFTVTAEDGYTKKKYALNYSKAQFDFDGIVIEKWGTSLLVNNNNTTNGGFTFSAYEWMKNGNVVGTGQIYNEKPALDASAVYTLNLTTHDGILYSTCPSKVTKQPMSLMAYPNPAPAGSSITIKTQLPQNAPKNTTVSIYSITGNLVLTSTLTGEETRIMAPSKQGTYIVKVNAAVPNNEFKLVVK